MYGTILALLAMFAVLSAPVISRAQQAGAPSYADGDWWRVKVDVVRPPGVSVGGPQFGGFPEYRVEISAGKPTVFGIRGDDTKALNAPSIVALVLGKSGWRGELLRFPLRVGLQWTDQFQVQPRGVQTSSVEGRYEIQSWEKISAGKGDFDAFKIVMNATGPSGPKGKGRTIRTYTYYYAPAIKAIVSLKEDGPEVAVTSMLIDFNVK
jgi:hypothetical protein